MKHKKHLIVIAGPTAVGKTDLCVRMAKALGCDVISADSRQFYKELSIGTAKPSPAEMGGVVHHFVDFISIDQEFSAGKFELATSKLLPGLFAKTSCALLTGGSGLYIQAVCEGMSDMPDVQSGFRTTLYTELEHHGLAVLLEELRLKDPQYYREVDHNNPQRIVRALEVCRATGMPFSSFRIKNENKREYEIIKIGLDRERDELFERIDQRMDEMLGRGLVEEAERMYRYRHHNALKTVGYTEIFDFMNGVHDWNETVRLLKRNSRRYAKRQLTWFRKDPDFAWFHPNDFDLILSHVHKQMDQ